MKKVVKFENYEDLKKLEKEQTAKKYSDEELDEWREWAEKWVQKKEQDKG